METAIDLIITCMGRLEHLKLSLPQAVKQFSTQCYLVDYSCPDNCSDWVKQQGFPVTSIKVKNQQLFNLSKARNAGASAGKSPWLLFIDADILLADDFTKQLINRLQDNHSYHASPNQTGMMGTFFCQREHFIRLGGYDEIFQGWGCEDRDLYSRLAFNGVKKETFPSSLLTCIPHSDQLRTQNHADKNIRISHIINSLYLTGTRHLASLTGSWPKHELRLELYNSAIKAAREYDTESNNPIINIDPDHKNSNLRINLGKQLIRGALLSSELLYSLQNQADKTTDSQHSGTTICDTIDTIKQRWPSMISDSSESPLFILSAGFRSGSTLLQRMLFNKCWLWGEPYGPTGLLDHLIAPFLHLGLQWPADNFIVKQDGVENPQQRWIANLYPEPNHLISASQHYLEALYKTPALGRGYTRWGLKEVRLDGEHASFLHWLYPQAKFLLLIRNPYDAYRSYRQYQQPWYIRKPDLLIDSVEKFAQHWVSASNSFISHAESLNASIIQYEHMIDPEFDWSDIEAYLGFSVDKSALQFKIRGSQHQSNQPADLDKELKQLAELVNPLAAQFNYHL